MENDVLKIALPGGSRKHTFYKVEIDGQELWVDYTDMRKKKSNDSAELYRLEEGKLHFARFVRVGRLRKEGRVY